MTRLRKSVLNLCIFIVVLLNVLIRTHSLKKNHAPAKRALRHPPPLEIDEEHHVERLLDALDYSDKLSESCLDDDDSYFDSSYESYLDGMQSFAVSDDDLISRAEVSAKGSKKSSKNNQKSLNSNQRRDSYTSKATTAPKAEAVSAIANPVPTHEPSPKPPSKTKVKSRSPHGFLSITTPWVRNFLATRSKDVLLPVPKDFFTDNFNLSQLPPVIEKYANQLELTKEDKAKSVDGKAYPIYRRVLQLITQDEQIPEDTTPEKIEMVARALYYLVHQRYILSPRGLETVRRRFLLKQGSVDPIFGRCPKLECQGSPLLPIGKYSDLSVDSTIDSKARRYCFACNDIMHHWESKVDGCTWGPTFCFLFLMVHGKAVFGGAERPRTHDNGAANTIFGFEVHSSARTVWD